MKVDCVVIGAGTAGANAAYQLARRGRRVLLVERRAGDLGGAQWHNGVLDRHFERAGLAPPAGAERSPNGGAAHVVAGDAPGVSLSPVPTVRADMAALGRRLRGLAAEAGVELVEHTTVEAVHERGRRVSRLALRSQPPGGAERTWEVAADLFVDASGRLGVLRSRSAVLGPWCPPVPGAELCAAGDFEFEISDRDGATRFLDRYGAQPGDHVNRVGTNGGWSTRTITVSEDLDRVGVLVGCVADGRHGTVAGMRSAVLADEPWIGAELEAGRGLIPIRRPYARFTAPGLALVGDSACQVFPAHGSGIGIGLVAGTMLTEAADGAADPGDEAVLWRYQAAFQREHGGTLAGYDALRRMTTRLGGEGVARMLRAGVPSPSMVGDGLEQRWGEPSPAELVANARRLASDPVFAATLLPSLARAQAARAVGARHPREVDERALGRWDRWVRRLVGAPAGVGDGAAIEEVE